VRHASPHHLAAAADLAFGGRKADDPARGRPIDADDADPALPAVGGVIPS
jgi:hypothetical protein